MKKSLIIPLLFACGFVFGQAAPEVKSEMDSLIKYIREKNTESFALHTVYRGADNQRKWKDVYNPGNPEELKAAKSVLEQMKGALNSCNYK